MSISQVADVDPGPVAMTAATRVPAFDAAGARGHNWNGEDGGEELYWGHKTRRVFSLQPARPSAGRADVDSFLRGFFETRKGPNGESVSVKGSRVGLGSFSA